MPPATPAKLLGARNRGVELRPPTLDDVSGLVTALRRSRRQHRPWAKIGDTHEAVAAWVQRCAETDFQGLVALNRANGDPVAVFNLSQIFYGPFCNAYLGYYGLAPYIGHGWVRASLPLVLDVAFSQLRLHRIEANIQPANLASIALVRGAGFRLEGFSPRYLKIGGRWRDHERYAITAEERRNHRSMPPAPSALIA